MKETVQYLIFLAVVAGVGLLWSSAKCDAKTEGMNMQSKWGVFGGCQVKTPQGWIPLENYRAVQ